MRKKRRKSLFFLQEKRWKSLPKEAAGLAADWELERRTTASEAAGSGSKATPLLELWFPWFPSDLTISAAAAAAASSSLSPATGRVQAQVR